MSRPRTDYDDPLYGITAELIAAQSALNMEPLPKKELRPGAHYLSDLDEWAAHAYEHITAALKLAHRAQIEAQEE
jgi:hypothetical protein